MCKASSFLAVSLPPLTVTSSSASARNVQCMIGTFLDMTTFWECSFISHNTAINLGHAILSFGFSFSMDSSTLLDYALFQLTPTRTRCDLVLFYGGKTEKLASGLFEPFVCHLKLAKDLASRGGYSIKLCPPTHNCPWFTKGTFERFMQFVSTPAVLERFFSLEREILMIESSVQENELSNTNMAGKLGEGNVSVADTNVRKSNDSSKPKEGLERREDAAPEENSKIQLQRLLDTRKTLLHKEQAMAYARTLVAGFEMDNINDLIYFADTFGASRLREACVNFKELCRKKHGDGLWMEELAAMQACPPPELSFLGTSGIVLAKEVSKIAANLPNGGISNGDPLPNGSDSASSHASSDSKKDGNLAPSTQMATTDKVQVPMPWPNQIPQYMYNFQQLPPYQGFSFPPMQPIPPNYPRHMQWPPIMKDYRPAKMEKLPNRKGLEDSGEEKDTESSDSEVESDLELYAQDKKHSKDAPNKKKHRNKSSKTVVIRNINYINPKRRNGEKSESSSVEDELIDEDSLKQQVDDAVGSLEKLHKLRNSHKSSNTKGSNHDFENCPVTNASEGGKTNENWNTFQNLLMHDEEINSNGVKKLLHPVDILDQHFTVVNGPAINLESETVSKRKMAGGDSFVVTQKDAGHEGVARLEDFEITENAHPIMKRRDSVDADLVISRRSEELGRGIEDMLSPSKTESSIIKPAKGEDWFVVNHSGKQELINNEQTVFRGDCMLLSQKNGSNTEKGKKDVLIDDSFMIHPRPEIDDLRDSQWKTDVSMAMDLTLSCQPKNYTVEENHEVINGCQPNDLFMILERDSGFDSKRESWSTDLEIDISFMEVDRKSSSVETNNDTDKKLISNCDSTNVKNGRKVAGKDGRSKVLQGSLRMSKTEMMSNSKKSPLVTRPVVRKSKQEKEEEIRKQMEELLIQRQKRIAERSAASGFGSATTKKVPSDNKTAKGSNKLDKNKTHSKTLETSKISSVKVRAA